MNILAISGSARIASTNTALLRIMATLAPAGVQITVFDQLHRLPVFSPDLEIGERPAIVEDFIRLIDQSNGVIISSPEYVRAMPGGLKNAIDWLVSGEAIIDKPLAIIHGSHRGEDMLQSLRLVLSTVTAGFNPDIFARFSLISRSPEDISKLLSSDDNKVQLQTYIDEFVSYAAARMSAE